MELTPLPSASQRRSARIDFRCRAVLSGSDRQGHPFRADAETVQVSLYGARLRCNAPLQVGMQVRISIPGRNQSRIADVVWERITGDGEFGIELHEPGSFWGITIGPEKRHYVTAQPRHGLGDEPVSAPVADTEPGTAAENSKPARNWVQSEPPAPFTPAPDEELLKIPASGIQVLVSGISMSRTAFQETTLLIPDANDRATLSLARVVNTGTMLRVTFPAQNRVMFVRVTDVLSGRRTTTWQVCVELLGDLRFVRTNDGKMALTW